VEITARAPSIKNVHKSDKKKKKGKQRKKTDKKKSHILRKQIQAWRLAVVTYLLCKGFGPV
jgi:hypothetical protein